MRDVWVDFFGFNPGPFREYWACFVTFREIVFVKM